MNGNDWGPAVENLRHAITDLEIRLQHHDEAIWRELERLRQALREIAAALVDTGRPPYDEASPPDPKRNPAAPE